MLVTRRRDGRCRTSATLRSLEILGQGLQALDRAGASPASARPSSRTGGARYGRRSAAILTFSSAFSTAWSCCTTSGTSRPAPTIFDDRVEMALRAAQALDDVGIEGVTHEPYPILQDRICKSCASYEVTSDLLRKRWLVDAETDEERRLAFHRSARRTLIIGSARLRRLSGCYAPPSAPCGRRKHCVPSPPFRKHRRRSRRAPDSGPNRAITLAKAGDPIAQTAIREATMLANAPAPVQFRPRRDRRCDPRHGPYASRRRRSRRAPRRSTQTNQFPRDLWPQMGALGLHGITVEGGGWRLRPRLSRACRGDRGGLPGLGLGRPLLRRPFQPLRQPDRPQRHGRAEGEVPARS